MRRSTLLYLYFDQGGLLGQPRALITNRPLAPKPDMEGNIANYFWGRMTATQISEVIASFEAKHKESVEVGNLFTHHIP